MRLQAVLLPPPEVAADLVALVARVPGAGGQLQPVPAAEVHLRLASFGNVTRSDARLVRRALTDRLADHPPLRLRFSGGVALEPIGDDSVWAQLEGDVDAVSQLSRLVVDEALRIGFAVDRRLSRRLMRLARVTPDTTVELLERLLSQLDAHAGTWWSCDAVQLLTPRDRAADGPGASGVFEVWDTVPMSG